MFRLARYVLRVCADQRRIGAIKGLYTGPVYEIQRLGDVPRTEEVLRMTQAVYTAKRKALLASCVQARRCGLELTVMHTQFQLLNLRLGA